MLFTTSRGRAVSNPSVPWGLTDLAEGHALLAANTLKCTQQPAFHCFCLNELGGLALEMTRPFDGKFLLLLLLRI